MSIVTKSQAQAFFETGDTPTQAQFADFIDSIVFTPTAAVSGDRVIVVEGTASSSARRIGTVGAALVSARTTANALDTLGIGAAFQAAIGAATTASAQSQLGGGAAGRAVFEQATTASAQTVQGGGTVGRTGFEAGTTASAQTVIGGGAVGRTVFEQATTASAQTVQGGGAAGRAVFESATTASGQTNLGGGAAGRALFEAITTASADSLLPAAAVNISLLRLTSVAAVDSIQVSGMVTGNDYWISMDGMQVGSSAASINMRMIRAGATAAASADYNWTCFGAGTIDIEVGEDRIRLTGDPANIARQPSTQAGELFNAEIFIPNPMAAVRHNVTMIGGAWSDSNDNAANYQTQAVYASAAAISAVEFFPSTGAFAAVGQFAIRTRARS